MSMRQGYRIAFPDGRTVADPGIHSDSSPGLKRLRRHYGARIEWGPVVKVPPKKRKKARP